MKYMDLNHPNLRRTLQRLAGSRLEAKAAYAMTRFIQTVESELAQAAVKSNFLLKDFKAEFDDKGNPVMDENGEYKMAPEDKEGYAKKFKEFLDTEFSSKWIPFPARYLTGIPLAPMELMAIEPFVAGFEEWATDTNAAEVIESHLKLAQQPPPAPSQA